MYLPPTRVRTRTELAASDKKVAAAAARLRDALIEHETFLIEPSSLFWTPTYNNYVFEILSGLPCPDGGVWTQLDAPIPKEEDALAWHVASNSPTMLQLLDNLERRARDLADGRMAAKKRRQSTEEAADATVIRSLVSNLIASYRNVANCKLTGTDVDYIAQIVSVFADRFLGGVTFARCKKIAQRLLQDEAKLARQ